MTCTNVENRIRALNLLENTLDACLDQTMQTEQVLRALIYLKHQDPEAEALLTQFWAALGRRSDKSRWLGANASLNEIRRRFSDSDPAAVCPR